MTRRQRGSRSRLRNRCIQKSAERRSHGFNGSFWQVVEGSHCQIQFPGGYGSTGRSRPSVGFAFCGGSRPVLVAVAFAHREAQRESSNC